MEQMGVKFIEPSLNQPHQRVEMKKEKLSTKRAVETVNIFIENVNKVASGCL